MIYCFLGDDFGVSSCRFLSTVLQRGARLPIHSLNYWTVKSVVPVFLTWGVFECGLAHRRSVVDKIRCNPMHPLYGALPVPYLFVSFCFPVIFFHSMGWYCGAGVFGLIGC